MLKDKFGRVLVANVYDSESYTPRAASVYGTLQHMSAMPVLIAAPGTSMSGTTDFWLGPDLYQAKVYGDGTLLYATTRTVQREARDAVSNAKTARSRLSTSANLRRAESMSSPSGRVATAFYMHAGRVYALATRPEMLTVAAPPGMRDALLRVTERESERGVDITEQVVDAILSRCVDLSQMAENNYGVDINHAVVASPEYVTAIALLFNFMRNATAADMTAVEYAESYARDAFVLAEAVGASRLAADVNAYSVPFRVEEVISKLAGVSLTGQQATVLHMCLDDIAYGRLSTDRDLLIFGECLMHPSSEAVGQVGDRVTFTSGLASVSVPASDMPINDLQVVRRAFRTAVASAYNFMYQGGAELFSKWMGYPSFMRKPAA